MNKLIFTAILLLFSISVFSQQKSQPKYILEAKKSFESGRYFEAATKTEKAYIKMGAKASIK
ncbi:MAG: hypothetical protein ACKO1R_06595, partial [Crocinitomicaceae bacterium]